MDYYEIDYYKYNKYLLSLTGNWPYQKPWKAVLLKSIVAFAAFSGVFILTAKLFTSNFETNIVMSVAPLLTCALLGVINLFFFYSNSHRFKEFWDRLLNSWKLDMNQKELEILRQFSREGRIYTLIYIWYGYGAVICLIPLSHKEKLLDLLFPLNESRPYEFPFYTDHLVDRDKYETYIYIHIHVIILIGLTAVLAYICSFLITLLHLTGLFTMLGYRIRHSFDHDEMNETNEHHKIHYKIDVYKNVTACIKIHKEIIEFVDLLQSFCAPVILIQLVGSAFIISTTIVQIIELEHIRIRFTAFCIAQFFYLLTSAHMSQKLMNSSENISIEVYNGTWYNQSIKIQKLLLLIIKRSHKPCVIHAYNMVILSMETTRWVTQTIVSYCTLFRQLQ